MTIDREYDGFDSYEAYAKRWIILFADETIEIVYATSEEQAVQRCLAKYPNASIQKVACLDEPLKRWLLVLGNDTYELVKARNEEKARQEYLSEHPDASIQKIIYWPEEE